MGGIVSPFAGSLSTRFGRRPIMGAGLCTSSAGILLTLAGSLSIIIVAMLLLCAGLFTTRPASSAFVGDNAKSTKVCNLFISFFILYGRQRGRHTSRTVLACIRMAGRSRMLSARFNRSLHIPFRSVPIAISHTDD
ncbi:MAG: hypothetical protein ACLPN1_00880 [Dissulfurispiraceae bacterium]